MNILYHHRTMGRGAEGAHIANIVKAFEAAGHKVFLVSPPGVDPLLNVGAKPLDKSDEKTTGFSVIWKFISRHAPQFVFELLEIAYNIQAIPRLREVVKNKNIDFIYERSAFFLLAGAYVSKSFHLPLIVEANEAVGIKRARPLILKRIALMCERYTMRQASTTFAVSSYLVQMLRKNSTVSANIKVMPNAIDPVKFQQTTRREQVREKYGISGKIVMGFAGWFDWWDRLDLLVDLQKELVDSGYDDVVTMLIGHGTMVDDLKKQIAALGLEEKVIMTGPVNKAEVLDYIDALDIGVLAHSNEFGSPMVLFELMALGKCVVAPDVAPVNDVIIDGDNGFIFSKLNKAALKEQLIKLLNNEMIRLAVGERARNYILTNNTWMINAERIIKVMCGQD